MPLALLVALASLAVARAAPPPSSAPALPPSCPPFDGAVAHCVVGLATQGQAKGHHPITDARNYKELRAFLERARRYGGRHDLFLSLDLRIWPPRGDAAAMARQRAFAEGGWRNVSAVGRVDLAALEPVVRVAW